MKVEDGYRSLEMQRALATRPEVSSMRSFAVCGPKQVVWRPTQT